LFIFVISCVVIYLFTIIHHLTWVRRFQPCLFPAPEIFIPDVYGTKKLASLTSTRKWSRFMVLISGACVMTVMIVLSTSY